MMCKAMSERGRCGVEQALVLRVLLLGEAAAGKTSVLRCLQVPPPV